jgi:hypothetical protein
VIVQEVLESGNTHIIEEAAKVFEVPVILKDI